MFKTTLSWFKKPAPPAPKEEPVIDAGTDRFVTSSTKNKHQLVRITMGESDSFVDIDYKQLTYAEAAALSAKNGSMMKTAPKKCTPPKPKAAKNAPTEAPEESDYYLFKSPEHYQRSRTYKGKQTQHVLQRRVEKEKKRKVCA